MSFLNSMPKVFSATILGILPALLILSGQWLADRQTEKDAEIRYSLHLNSIGDLTVINLKLTNVGKSAIDELNMNAPQNGLKESSFLPKSKIQTNSAHNWKGSLEIEQNLRVLLVYRNSIPSKLDILQNSILARYQARDKIKGTLSWKNVELLEGKSNIIPNYIIYWLWLLLPTGLIGFLWIIFWFLRKYLSQTSIES